MATRASAAGQRVVIVSADKDFAQLLRGAPDESGSVSQLRPRAGTAGGGYDHFSMADFATKHGGLPPSAFPDLMALVGDAVDDIPGVRGIGEKGAVALVSAHGAVEDVVRAAGAARMRRAARAHAARRVGKGGG